jgi:signal transduction histidine kinase/DNA-binding response OmpR family regulator
MLSFLNRIGIAKTDPEEQALQKNFMVYLGSAMSLGGLVWGSICAVLGLYLQGLIPYGYTVLTIINFYYFHTTKNFIVSRFFQVLISLLLPFAFQFVMGGFVASGGVMLWSIISLISALTFVSVRTAMKWWAMYILITIGMGVFDPHSVKAYEASAGLSVTFFVINITIISSIVFGLSYYFVDSNRKLGQRMEVARQQAEAASRVKSEFLANMSHEIRTPLNGVIGFSELMTKTPLNETQQQYMSMVSQSGNLLLDIINDILDFSKIEAGKLDLTIEKTDLYETCMQVADMVKFQAHKKGLELLLNIAGDSPRCIWADEVRLRQILVNLLSNAVKFTPTGEIELRVETVATPRPGINRLRFSVRDTGIGINPRSQEKIFKAFSQEDASTTKKFGGTGLGLTISNKLLALAKSELRLESEPGKGSTFFFEIDCRSTHEAFIRPASLEQIGKVLIVDDNESNRRILTDMLALQQVPSHAVCNGAEALEAIKQHPHYGLVIMDYHMPGMDGLETVAQIRNHLQHPTKPPVVLLYSSSADSDISKACEELHIRHRLVKPATMRQLFNVIGGITVNDMPKKATPDSTSTRPALAVGADVKILVAEDNSVNMLLCKTFINKILPSATIYESQNGLEAVTACRTLQPDIIFMDIQMPEMNGYDATKAIRESETGRRTPIIALTAGTVKGEKEKCMQAGMDDFMTKPFVKSEMERVLSKWAGAMA